MKCKYCNFIGRGSKVYLSAKQGILLRCPECGQYNKPDRYYIKGFCKDCYWYMENELGEYCFQTIADVDKDKDYCSKWISIEDGEKLPTIEQK